MREGKSGKEPEGVEDVIGELDELASQGDKVRIGDVLDDFGERSFGPFIMIFALVEITPIGAIPGAPTVLASIIALVAVQLLLGKDHIWMPQFIQDRAVESKKLHKAIGKLRGVAHWLDGHSRDRVEFLTKGIWIRIAALAILILCATVPPLEVLPFASSAPMLAIATIGLALIVRDGLVMLAALLLAAAAVAGGTYYYYNSDDEESSSSAWIAPLDEGPTLT
ncbi:exopolysaccharide biosynthesis protein [Qipengyuania sp. 1XM1-15A]|uniref:exopolysaccharide biosynthesis protein n=1 Tax=Qipengyuania xiamenensis TaxID=2867237 RepID=UPI001C8812C9|nr:exopolysaccharide biosynthesis protein [Qipengyuania xiamenensis]MBX7532605.1 exopolysaccharide biosynthesis protein [Qipengyuania xiamenensis]